MFILVVLLSLKTLKSLTARGSQRKGLTCTFFFNGKKRVRFRDVDLRIIYIQDPVNKSLLDGGSR